MKTSNFSIVVLLSVEFSVIEKYLGVEIFPSQYRKQTLLNWDEYYEQREKGEFFFEYQNDSYQVKRIKYHGIPMYRLCKSIPSVI